MVKNEAPFFGYTTFHNQPIVLYRKRVGRFLFVVKTAELLNIFLIVLMALFLNNGVKSTIDPCQIKCYMLQHVTST